MVLVAAVAGAETEIVPWDKKPGQGYTIDPKDETAAKPRFAPLPDAVFKHR